MTRNEKESISVLFQCITDLTGCMATQTESLSNHIKESRGDHAAFRKFIIGMYLILIPAFVSVVSLAFMLAFQLFKSGGN